MAVGLSSQLVWYIYIDRFDVIARPLHLLHI
jgi:hypothetical protein